MDTKLAVTGILNETLGKRDQVLADLQVLLDNSVGVGEHTSICEEVKAKLETLNTYDGLVETITRYTTPPEQTTEQATPDA